MHAASSGFGLAPPLWVEDRHGDADEVDMDAALAALVELTLGAASRVATVIGGDGDDGEEVKTLGQWCAAIGGVVLDAEE